MMAIIKLALSAFTGASTITKLISVGIVLITLAGAYGVWHAKVYNRGYDAALRAIAAQNQRAIKRAQEYRGRVTDCDARGLRWDQSTGECQ